MTSYYCYCIIVTLYRLSISFSWTAICIQDDLHVSPRNCDRGMLPHGHSCLAFVWGKLHQCLDRKHANKRLHFWRDRTIPVAVLVRNGDCNHNHHMRHKALSATVRWWLWQNAHLLVSRHHNESLFWLCWCTNINVRNYQLIYADTNCESNCQATLFRCILYGHLFLHNGSNNQLLRRVLQLSSEGCVTQTRTTSWPKRSIIHQFSWRSGDPGLSENKNDCNHDHWTFQRRLHCIPGQTNTEWCHLWLIMEILNTHLRPISTNLTVYCKQQDDCLRSISRLQPPQPSVMEAD